MSQYCSLQEAYNVPSFSSKKKKSCLPLDPNASAEPYDPFSEQKAREQSSYNIERFENKKPTRQDLMGDSEKVTYKGLMTDYDYYCKNTGICALEGFSTKKQNSTMENNPKPVKKDTCAPLNPPNYEYPISDIDKAKFQAALKIALEQMDNVPPPSQKPKSELRPATDLDNVYGYVDEELESYMTVNEMKAAPKITALPVKQTLLKDVPGFDSQVDKVSPFEKDVKKHIKPENYTRANALWMDLLLFISSGLLLIFLLEQLYKIALMAGMKKTLQAMDTLLRMKNE